MGSARIEVAFDGDALAGGAMEVRHLAPALFALGNAIEESNLLLNGEKRPISVRVQSDFQAGSFLIVINVALSVVDQIASLVGLESLWVSASQLVEYIGLKEIVTESLRDASRDAVIVTLIEFLKKLNGREIESATEIQDGRVSVKVKGDNNTIIVVNPVFRLAQNMKLRKHLRDALAPLSEEGIDHFEVRKGRRKITRIKKDELAAFDPPDETERNLTDSTSEKILEIIAIVWPEGRKWEFWDGDSKINARVTDVSFLADIDEGRVSFSKGDKLLVRLRTRQSEKSGKLETDHEIVKVLQHFKRDEQLRFEV